MHVISCIKLVPDTTQVKIDPVTNTLIRDGIPFMINVVRELNRPRYPSVPMRNESAENISRYGTTRFLSLASKR